MKRVFLIFAFLSLILASCEQPTILSVSQTALSFENSGGNQSVMLTANKPWSASSNQSWCKVSPSGGEEATGSRISFSCDANTTYDARNATVTITCAELTKQIAISQATNNGLLVSQTSYELTKAAQQLNIQVQANVKFSVEVDNGCKDWVKYNSTKGLTTSTVVLDIAENKTYDSREGKVTIKQDGGNLSSTVTIKQSQLEGLFITTPEYTLSNEKHTLTVEVSTNVEFDVKPEADWVKYVQTKGLNTKQIVLQVEENDTYVKRETKVNVKQKNGDLSGTITIKQDEKYGFVVTQTEYNLTDEAQTIKVEVKYNVAFEVVIPDDCKDWIKQVSTKALNSKTYTFSIAKNETYDNREGSITFKQKDGPLGATVSIRQEREDGLFVTKSDFEISQESQTVIVEVKANVDYEARSQVDWISVVSTKGLQSSQITLSVDENPGEEAREGIVSVMQKGGGLTGTITIKQEGDRQYIKEREALIALYNATDGPHWLNNENWCSDKPLEDWYGVFLSSTGHVYYLDLLVNGLNGTIPPEIGDLSYLEILYLQVNNLTGPIPAEIGRLKHLSYLDLSDNQLTGPIPSEIGRLESLSHLVLENNQLTGSIPPEIGLLPNLEFLDLYNNPNLSGSIPAEIGNLSKLRFAFLHSCNLTGNLPVELTRLHQVERFSCGNNPLSGTVPAAFAQWEYWNDGWGELIAGTSLDWKEATPHCPHFSVKTFDGATVTSDIFEESELTVFFQWASWCPFSPLVIPIMKSAYSRFKERGLSILGWSMDQEEGSARQYAASYEMSWPNFFASDENHIRTKSAQGLWYYPIGDMPSITVYDKEGKLVYTHCLKDDNYMESFAPFIAKWFDDPNWNWHDEKPYESSDFSRDGKVTVLQKATVGKGINLVFLGDGYSDRLIADGTYEKIVRDAVEGFFSIEPYRSLRNMFNVLMMDVVSLNEYYAAGSTQTAFSAEWQGDTHIRGNDDRVIEYVSSVIPDDEMDNSTAIVIMNLDLYAGTCVMYPPKEPSDAANGFAIAYFPANKENLAYLACHEAGGHGFAKLSDEYVLDNGRIEDETVNYLQTSARQYGWYKNLDFTSDPADVKWNYFLKDKRYAAEDMGVFEGAYYYQLGAYRPSNESIMNTDHESGFNAPSREAIWYRAHKLAYGPDWNYSYEDFVAYDAVNRKPATKASSCGKQMKKQLPPLAPPVIMDHSWKEEIKKASCGQIKSAIRR